MFRRLVLVGIVCGFTASRSSADDGSYIFLISAKASGQSIPRAGTGFLMPGAGGIVVSLHTVVGATNITAKRSSGTPLREPLKILKVDIARDLAVLSSSEVSKLRNGLHAAHGTSVPDRQKLSVRVVGYPAGIDRKEMSNTLTLQDPPRRELDKCVNDELRKHFEVRKSPALSTIVYCLEGPLYPGHSGSPILDSEGNVIAVASGGLGFTDFRLGLKGWKDTELVWAIPLKDVEWSSCNDPVVQKEIKRLVPLSTFGFALIDPEKMRLVLQEYAVVEATGDTLVTVMKYPPREYFSRLVGEGAAGLKDVVGGMKQKGNARPLKPIQPGDFFFIVPSGTQVQILETTEDTPGEPLLNLGDKNNVDFPFPILPDGGHYKIRILTGKYEGKEGWVAGHFVRKKQVRGHD